MEDLTNGIHASKVYFAVLVIVELEPASISELQKDHYVIGNNI
jgi:hypothetical protein